MIAMNLVTPNVTNKLMLHKQPSKWCLHLKKSKYFEFGAIFELIGLQKIKEGGDFEIRGSITELCAIPGRRVASFTTLLFFVTYEWAQ
jgi:hypothetical protein